MNGKSDFGFSRVVFVKPLAPLVTGIVSAVLLGGLLHNKPALAADGCPAPSFAPARAFDAGRKPVSLAAGEFNGDGKSDLVVANWGAGTVSVLLSKGEGNFHLPISSESGGGILSAIHCVE